LASRDSQPIGIPLRWRIQIVTVATTQIRLMYVFCPGCS
jgi:hypothetical protein